MSSLRTQAIVLRRTNYGEADRILQLLTPQGKKSVLAKSVRREKSRLAGGIELFAISDVVINEGKGDLGILTSARLVHFYRHILEDYETMQFGYEVVKQISKASEMVDESEWFDMLAEILPALNNKTVPRQLVQIWFYLRYAALLGSELSLHHDINGRPLHSDTRYSYDVAEKGLRQNERGELSSDHIKYLRIVSVKSLATVAQIGGVESILAECWHVARQHAAIH